MKAFLTFIPVLSAAVTTATATCLTDADAKKVAHNFANLFSNFSAEAANATLTRDFTDQTDSVSWLINNGTNCPKPLGQNTLNSRAEYIQAQATQPNLPFIVENTWHDCTNVFIRWFFDIQPQRVQGIAVLGTVPNRRDGYNHKNPYLIKHVFSEFNTGAFIENLGYYKGVGPCGPNTKREDFYGKGMPRLNV